MAWQNAFGFLIDIIFSIYILVIFLRLIFQIVRADFYNPISQFIIKVSNPCLKPLRRVIPGIMGIDFAAVILIIVLDLIKLIVIAFLYTFSLPNMLGLLIWMCGDLLRFIFQFYFFILLIIVILSWVAPHRHDYLTSLIHKIGDPLMRPIRKYIPPIGGFDFSVLILAIVIQFLAILIIHPLYNAGQFYALTGFN